MRLPPTNTLVLAEGNDALVLDRTDRPAPSREALLALLPGWVRSAETPLRDAALDMLAAQVNFTWARIGLVFAQLRSPRHAAGLWLDAWGALRHRPRALRESEGAYRARLLAPTDVVTPTAIRRAVEALVTPVTVTPAALLEPAVDGMFASAEDSTWACFVQGENQRLFGDDPTRPGEAWGAWLAPPNGASFWVILPISADEGEPVVFAESGTGDANSESFAAPADGAFGFAFRATDTLLERVALDVEPRRGGGVGWLAWNDPLLNGAV